MHPSAATAVPVAHRRQPPHHGEKDNSENVSRIPRWTKPSADGGDGHVAAAAISLVNKLSSTIVASTMATKAGDKTELASGAVGRVKNDPMVVDDANLLPGDGFQSAVAAISRDRGADATARVQDENSLIVEDKIQRPMPSRGRISRVWFSETSTTHAAIDYDAAMMMDGELCSNESDPDSSDDEPVVFFGPVRTVERKMIQERQLLAGVTVRRPGRGHAGTSVLDFKTKRFNTAGKAPLFMPMGSSLQEAIDKTGNAASMESTMQEIDCVGTLEAAIDGRIANENAVSDETTDMSTEDKVLSSAILSTEAECIPETDLVSPREFLFVPRADTARRHSEQITMALSSSCILTRRQTISQISHVLDTSDDALLSDMSQDAVHSNAALVQSVAWLQSRSRALPEQNALISIRAAVEALQIRASSLVELTSLKAFHDASVLVQRRWRSRLERHMVVKSEIENLAATVIQTRWRGYLARKVMAQVQIAVTNVQGQSHAQTLRASTKAVSNAVHQLQAAFRGCIQRESFIAATHSIASLQSFAIGEISCRQFGTVCRAISHIQATSHSTVVRIEFGVLLSAVFTIQRWWRRVHERRIMLASVSRYAGDFRDEKRRLDCAVKIQQWWRRVSLRRILLCHVAQLAHQVRENKRLISIAQSEALNTASALIIQRWWRRLHMCRSMLLHAAQVAQQVRDSRRQTEATRTISAWLSRSIDRHNIKSYLSTRRQAALVIQRWLRRAKLAERLRLAVNSRELTVVIQQRIFLEDVSAKMIQNWWRTIGVMRCRLARIVRTGVYNEYADEGNGRLKWIEENTSVGSSAQAVAMRLRTLMRTRNQPAAAKQVASKDCIQTSSSMKNSIVSQQPIAGTPDNSGAARIRALLAKTRTPHSRAPRINGGTTAEIATAGPISVAEVNGTKNMEGPPRTESNSSDSEQQQYRTPLSDQQLPVDDETTNGKPKRVRARGRQATMPALNPQPDLDLANSNPPKRVRITVLPSQIAMQKATKVNTLRNTGYRRCRVAIAPIVRAEPRPPSPETKYASRYTDVIGSIGSTEPVILENHIDPDQSTMACAASNAVKRKSIVTPGKKGGAKKRIRWDKSLAVMTESTIPLSTPGRARQKAAMAGVKSILSSGKRKADNEPLPPTPATGKRPTVGVVRYVYVDDPDYQATVAELQGRVENGVE